MKVKPVHWIALALALALTVAVCDGLRIRDGYSIAVGKYQAALDSSRALNAEKDKAIGQMTRVIGQKTAQIAELLGNAGKPTETEIAQDKIIADQKRKIAEMEEQGDLAGALVASKAESRAWAEKFALAEERHKTAIFDLNVAWTVKYEAQVTISESWKQDYKSELHLRTLAEKGWKVTERKLKWTRIVGNIKSGLVLAAAGYVGYSALKGK